MSVSFTGSGVETTTGVATDVAETTSVFGSSETLRRFFATGAEAGVGAGVAAGVAVFKGVVDFSFLFVLTILVIQYIMLFF